MVAVKDLSGCSVVNVNLRLGNVCALSRVGMCGDAG
jgi:hypothetical protein